jgi:hypothetical protein
MERLIDEKKVMIFETTPKLFTIGTIIISEETISLQNIGVLEIKINQESKSHQRTLDQRTIEVVPSTTKTS